MSEKDTTQILRTELLSNYPNPFNPSTMISFDIKNDGPVRLEVFNLKGQKVTTLVDEDKTSGRYQVAWNGTDTQGRDVGTGIYFYRLTTNDTSSTRKMLLMK